MVCLILNGSNSCSERHNKAIPRPPQTEVSLLNNLLEQVSKSEEPALRIFLRLKIATYLWNNPSGPVKPEAVAEAALADIRDHEKEIPALYVNLFRRELVAQLKAHGFDVSAYVPTPTNPQQRTEFEVAYSLLGQENSVEKAVGIMRRKIADGNDPGRIIVPFMQRLEQSNPVEVLKLLETIMSAEEAHPGSISSGTLFGLKHLFIREQTPQDLQHRYIAAVISRAGEKEASTGSLVDFYTILADVGPGIKKQSPELYYLATARLSELAGQVPSATIERIAIDKRVRQSGDPLAQLLSETEAVSDPSLKEELKIEAAQVALEKGQIRTAIDLVANVQTKTRIRALWRDQFLEGAVERAVAKGDVNTARFGIDQIRATGIRSSALQKLALYFQVNNDSARAREALNSALTLITASDDSVDKAVWLLDLAGSFVKVDRERAPKLVRAAVKVINKSPEILRRAERGSDAQLSDVESMMKILYKLIPTFQALGNLNEPTASDIAKDIQRQEFRLAAMFGASTDLNAVDKNKQGVASK
jgi:hypothetical protein